MESQMIGFLFIAAVCACTCASLPANSRRQEDIHQLVSLLGKLKNIGRVRQQQQYHHNRHHSKQQHPLLSGVSLSSIHAPAAGSSSPSEFASAGDKAALMGSVSDLPAEALTSPDVTNSLLLGQADGDFDLGLAEDDPAAGAEGFLRGRNSEGSGSASEKSKRQGAWSYDYGLGGGRFGKRSYGDYGFGGGRYGRDVDHVDISDTSDADASTL